jgi:hypothetical protein
VKNDGWVGIFSLLSMKGTSVNVPTGKPAAVSVLFIGFGSRIGGQGSGLSLATPVFEEEIADFSLCNESR